MKDVVKSMRSEASSFIAKKNFGAGDDDSDKSDDDDVFRPDVSPITKRKLKT